MVNLKLTKENEARVLEIDKGVKNKFRWGWLEKTVTMTVKIGKTTEEVTEKISDFIVKCDIPGKVQCTYCNDFLNYASRGCVALIEHCSKRKHIDVVGTRRSNYSLGAAFKTIDGHGQIQMPVEQQSSQSAPITPISDRKTHSEEEIHIDDNACALVLSVVAEHSLPFTMAPVIVETARILAKDPKALNHINLDRTTASYKMRFGLAKTIKEETLENLRTQPFSLNLDESTSNSDKRVLAILVSYYNPKLGKVVVEHLDSLEVVKVDSESLLKSLSDLFENLNIPWKNLVSVLMDSCSVMRGSKNGVEVRIRRDKAPQLLDVDGDSCHHMHNACKQFCKPFAHWAEYLQSDLHNDVKWSPDLKVKLEEICGVLGVKFTMPERFINHRWLSCYDACHGNIHMIDAFKLFYYPFLDDSDRLLFKEPMMKLLLEKKASSNAIKRVKNIWSELAQKSLTEDGKKRKMRIAEKLIIQEKKTSLIMNFFIETLPLLKEYVALFQSSEPLIHVLHDQQEQVFKNFLACFIKAEFLLNKSAHQLKSFNLESDEGQFLKIHDMHIGRKAKSLVKESHKKDAVCLDFLKQASAAFINCGKHMQKRLPLTNPLLQAMSALDPAARGSSESTKALEKLSQLLDPFLADNQKETVSLEIRKFQVDSSLKPPQEDERVDVWWSQVIATKKYPALCRMAMVCVSCFHGPRVESSFNTMGDIIDIRSTRMNISSFSSMQTVKYSLKSNATTSTALYKKGDVKHERVDQRMCVNFKNSASSYKKEKDDKRKEKELKQKVLNLPQSCAISKEAGKRDREALAKTAMLAHRKAEKRKAAARLVALVAKKKKVV